MDILDRRAHLTVVDNPDNRLDYVVTLAGEMRSEDSLSGFEVELRYIPDRLILEPQSFAAYLSLVASLSLESLERIAATVLDDINNEVVARWVQIAVTRQPTDGVATHSVFLEDRQPNWRNPDILARLRRH